MNLSHERGSHSDDAADLERRQRLTFNWSDLPLVTAGLPGTGGRIRQTPEDFQVEEIPAYEPDGHGSHLYLKVRKRGLTTRDLVTALINAGLDESAVGVAGLKDKAAVTVQWLSLPKRVEEAAAALEALPGAEILERSYHRNKLGLGHLRGNRFVITVRDVEPSAADRAEAAFAALAREGAPNWFGPQRFGRFGSNAYDGWKVISGESVPGGHRLRRFFVSALQSLAFNAILADRIAEGLYDTVVSGDWARKHDTGGTFLVEDAVAEAPRAERLEISATIPLYGRKVRPSPGMAGELEAAVMERFELQWQQFTSRRGDRRSSRILVDAPTVEERSDGLVLSFALPKGSYATSVLREVMKVDVDEPVDHRLEVEADEDSAPSA
ncbi:MAG TPA: tRNA pseudouridine(13) synthase TruD [Trueperaceae bacterium]|nr:tRNA pseudouridine(13) synthase TruD [Trueperaceae bacterium]